MDERAQGPARDEPARRAPRQRAWLAAVLLAALAVRVAYVLQQRANPLFDAPQMDPAYHLAWARAFAAGEPFLPGEPFYRAPLYSWFLGVVLWLGGPGLLVPRLVQAVCGVATCALTYALGARAFRPAVGLVAAAGTALYWPLIDLDAELLDPTLAIPLNLAALWLALALGERPSSARGLAAGAAFGLAAIARPTILPCALCVGAWAAWRARRGGPRPTARAARVLVAFALGLAAPILPLTLHNALAGGDLVLISSTGGVNLWIGNHPGADGSSALVPGARADLWGGIEDAEHLAEAEAGRELEPSGVSRHWARKAWAQMLDSPGRALALCAWKARLLWSDVELGNNGYPSFMARRFAPFVRFLPLSFGVVAPLALVGLFVARRELGRLFPLWTFLAVQAGLIVLYFVNGRFRAPLVPVLCVFAALALCAGFDALRARRFGAFSAGAAAALVLAFTSFKTPRAVDTSDAGGLWQLGLIELQAGRAQDAERLMRASTQANPRFLYGWRGLAEALFAQGRTDEARVAFERALALVPTDLATLDRLAELCATIRPADWAAVAELGRRALAASPASPLGHFHLGRGLLELAQHAPPAERRRLLEQAAAELERAAAPAPDFASLHLLGRARHDLGQPAAAALAFAGAAVFVDPAQGPWFWTNAEAWIGALRADGRADEACELARGWQQSYPAVPDTGRLASLACRD